jgi:putative nucleotidyltransferase with HDIG domain
MEEGQKPRAIYRRALKAVDHIFEDIQGGRIPSTDEVREVSKEMVQSILQDSQALLALSQIKEYDHYTFTHSVNVGIIALSVGRACDLHPQQLQLLAFGGMVHDIGKLKVPIEIITKPGRLNDSEFRQIARHPETGAELLRQDSSVPREVVDIVHYHHLHYNRDGYPKYRGQEISPLVDMVTIADHYDAMTTHRSYQQPIPPREAIRKMSTLSGNHLHPEYLASFNTFLGEYPVGTLLRLDNSEIALVVGFDAGDTSRLRLRRLFDTDGRPAGNEVLSELPQSAWGRIVAEINPAHRGIDVCAYFQ